MRDKLALTPEQELQMRHKALTAIDGLWFLGVEKRFGFDAALDIDVEAWTRFGPVMVRKLKRVLNIEKPTLDQAWQMWDYLSQFAGVPGEITEQTSNSMTYTVRTCPFWDTLKKAGRDKLVPCHKVDIASFSSWGKAIDERFDVEFLSSMPEGQETCCWRVTLKEES